MTFIFAANQEPHCWQDLGVSARGTQTRRVARDVRDRCGRSGFARAGQGPEHLRPQQDRPDGPAVVGDVVKHQLIDEVVAVRVAHGEREAQHLVQLALHGFADAGVRRERRGVLDDVGVAGERPLQNAPADVDGQHPADREER
uniref:hypothetical protein n=1 Tax=Streptomyces sp. SAT1 TaxID=1849967 RepID=UPI0007F9A033|nr:hypothetical protein [Streptomyces sp. SAT1]ANO42051.1 hypothetical protein A8713_032845 [Streptomyces sp. SAT1]